MPWRQPCAPGPSDEPGPDHIGGARRLGADAAPDARPHCPATAHRCAHAADARGTAAPAARRQCAFHGARAAGFAGAAAVGKPARRHQQHGCVPGGQLAGAVRHCAGPGPPVGHDAGADQRGCAGLHRVCGGPLASCRCALPPAVPVPAHGPGGRFSHGRSVQPVRVLRDHAGGLLWPAAAWIGSAARAGGVALHRHQSGGVLAVSGGRVDAVRHHRHAEHGRSCAGHSTGGPRRPWPAARRRRHPGDGLSHQGGGVAAQLLARASLQCRHGARGRAVCADDQGGCLHDFAAVDPAVQQRSRRLRTVWQPVADWWRHGHHGVWRRGDAGLAAPHASGRVCRHPVVRHPAGRGGIWPEPAHGRAAVLPAQFHAGRQRPFPDG